MELPKIFTVRSNVHETNDVFTLGLTATDGKPFDFLPGQFNMLYLFGIGEIPVSICSSPDTKEILLHTIRAVGAVSNGLQKLKVGDEIGIRGPFGTSWPLSKKNCDVLIIGGGVALPPLRTSLYTLAANKQHYKKITFLYGARTPDDIMCKDDLECWKKSGIDVQISVDHPDEQWNGHVGVVTSLIATHIYNPKNTTTFICGPEIMIHFALKELIKAQVDEEQIYVSMERNMQCGVGICGHCQYGPYFMCKDGPVFSYPQIKKWFAIKEL